MAIDIIVTEDDTRRWHSNYCVFCSNEMLPNKGFRVTMLVVTAIPSSIVVVEDDDICS